jgi:hypothetical protein
MLDARTIIRLQREVDLAFADGLDISLPVTFRDDFPRDKITFADVAKDGPWSWSMETSFTEAEVCVDDDKLRYVVEQKLGAILLKYKLDIEEMAYTGDAAFGATGLINYSDACQCVFPAPFLSMSEAETIDAIDRMILAGEERDERGIPTPSKLTKLLVSPALYGQWAVTRSPIRPYQSVLTSLQSMSLIPRLYSDMPNLKIEPCKWVKEPIMYVQAADAIGMPCANLTRTPVEARGGIASIACTGAIGKLQIRKPALLRYAVTRF